MLVVRYSDDHSRPKLERDWQWQHRFENWAPNQSTLKLADFQRRQSIFVFCQNLEPEAVE
jgi:hypothetical protein